MKIYVAQQHIGCDLNYQPVLIYRELKKRYELTDNVKEADIIVFAGTMACTGNEVLNTIEYIKSIISQKKEGAKTFLTGCLTREFTNPEFSFVSDWLKDNIDVIVPQNEPGNLLQSIYGSDYENKFNYFGHIDIKNKRGTYVGRIYLSSGCLNKCTFCKATYQNLSLKSAELKIVEWGIDQLNMQGINDLELLGTNIAQYGLDINGTYMLPSVLEHIEEAGSIKNVQLIGFAFKDAIEGNLTPVLRDSSKVHFISGGLESGSDRILKLMKKGFTSEQFVDFVHTIQDKHFLGLDLNVIAGFPTETEEDLEDTINVLKAVRPVSVAIVEYLNSPQVASSKYEQLSQEEIDGHAKYLHRKLHNYGIRSEIINAK